jgi:hypothetical protein
MNKVTLFFEADGVEATMMAAQMASHAFGLACLGRFSHPRDRSGATKQQNNHTNPPDLPLNPPHRQQERTQRQRTYVNNLFQSANRESLVNPGFEFA